MATRLDLSGLSYLWDKIKAKFATKEVATTSDAGLMSASDKAKLDGIAAGAQVNSLTGVKGNAESSYRTGNVNITPANIGAVAKSGDTMTGGLSVSTNGEAVQLNAINSDYGLGIALLSAISGWHGIYSGGYYNGTQTIVDPKWIIARTSNGQPYMEIPLPVNSGGTGATTAAQAAKNITGLTWDLITNNTSDSWVPVLNSGTLQHRVIPTAYNSTPLSITAGGTGATTAAQARANLEVLRTGHLNPVNLDTILYNFLGTVWNISGTGVSVFSSNCGTLICTDVDPFGTSGSRLRQIYMDFFGNDIWIRKRKDTTWSEWTCLLQNNGAVPVSAGGTGATTAAQACANIGAMSLKSRAINANTTSNANLQLIARSEGVPIILTAQTNNGVRVYAAFGNYNDNYWGAKIFDNASNPVASTTIVGTLYYA